MAVSKIAQVAGASGDIYLNNFMIYASQNASLGAETRGIEDEKLAIENMDDYPTASLTQEEQDAFLTIAERVIPLPNKELNPIIVHNGRLSGNIQLL